MTSIDMNADLGEGAGTDAELLMIVSSCNVACGGHAGDAETMAAAGRSTAHRSTAAHNTGGGRRAAPCADRRGTGAR